MSDDERWYFTKDHLENSPSRKNGIDADKELANRQQAANFIRDMGQRLQVTQLCINTAIVYTHRFYVFHSFTHFHRNAIATAALFLAAKVEEQPRKLEHIIKVAQLCLTRTQPSADRRSEVYMKQAQELVMNENILLQTLGFDVAIEHPHSFIIKFCHLANVNKDLSQSMYFMASNSLYLTTMCLQYKPTVVACFCIHLVCKWSNCEIPKSKENLSWYSYIDKSVTQELLEQLTNEFLVIFDKCPSRLKKKIQNSQDTLTSQNFLANYSFSGEWRRQNANGQSAGSSSNNVASASTSSSSSSSTSTSQQQQPQQQQQPLPQQQQQHHHHHHHHHHQENSKFVTTSSDSEIISNVVKEVAMAKQNEKRVVKTEPLEEEDIKPFASVDVNNVVNSIQKPSKNHSIFSPSPIGHDSLKSPMLDERIAAEVQIKQEPVETPSKTKNRQYRPGIGESELIPVVKKVETVAGYEDIFKKNVVVVPSSNTAHTSPRTEYAGAKDNKNNFHGVQIKEEPKPSTTAISQVIVPNHNDEHAAVRDKTESAECSSAHLHKKKKKHKEKDKRHDKEKRHKEKKRHKEDKHHHRKEHSREKDTLKEPGPIKITIPKEKLVDIPMKLKIKINKDQIVAPSTSEESGVAGNGNGNGNDFKFKISKDMLKSRKRERESDHDHSSKKFAYGGTNSHNGYKDYKTG